jgi:HK97 gp10 family phage protein
MTFDASQIHQISADLTNVGARTGRRAQLVFRKVVLDIEATAKNKAPVDTGNLKGSIGHSDLRSVGTSGSMHAEIGPTAEYGAFVEFGTSRMAPQPYMGPAADQHFPLFAQAVEQLGLEALGG